MAEKPSQGADLGGNRRDMLPSSPLGNDVALMASNMDAILSSQSYMLAHDDHKLLEEERMRGVRMLLELEKPEMAFQADKIHSTVIVFGGTAIVVRPAVRRVSASWIIRSASVSMLLVASSRTRIGGS